MYVRIFVRLSEPKRWNVRNFFVAPYTFWMFFFFSHWLIEGLELRDVMSQLAKSWVSFKFQYKKKCFASLDNLIHPFIQKIWEKHKEIHQRKNYDPYPLFINTNFEYYCFNIHCFSIIHFFKLLSSSGPGPRSISNL